MKRARIIFIFTMVLPMALAAGLMFSCGRSGGDSAEHDHPGEEAAGHVHDGDNGAEEPGSAASAGGEHSDNAAGESMLRMDDSRMKEYGIELDVAGPGEIESSAGFPGEVVFDGDRTVQVVSPVGGIVREVRKTLGANVRAGEALAVIESRELAEAMAEYLACMQRQALAETVFNRERVLREKNVSSEQELLDSHAAMTEALIQFRAAKQKLHALGLTGRDIEEAAKREDADMARYSLASPRTGTIVERFITAGDVISENTPVFRVSDLGTVWVDFNVSQHDIAHLKEGMTATVTATGAGEGAAGRIIHVGRMLDPEKRTALARAVLPNPDGRWRPGLFVTGLVELSRMTVPVRTPVESVQTVEGNPVVFVRTGDAFEPRRVITGKKDRNYVEIESGLNAGERYASRGAFRLKASIATSALGGHAGHGH